MAHTTFDNVILTKDGKTVTIATIPTDEENLTKSLLLITEPITSREVDPDDPAYATNNTKILDLSMKQEQRINIDGFLVTSLRTVAEGDSSENAQDKKADLKKMFLGQKVMSMTYEGATFNVNLEKLSIRRIDTDGNVAVDGLAEFSVKFTAIRGDNLVNG